MSSNWFGQTVIRRMLLLDRPVARRSEHELTAEAERNYLWNFTVNLLDGATFWFGNNFVSAATILPLFISKLTDSPLLIGLVAVIAQAGWLIPQVFTAGFTEKLSRKKPLVINVGFFLERLPVWFWPVSALIAPHSSKLALVVFFVSYAWHGLGAGAIAPAWQDMIARCFPVKKRGRFFGTTTFVGTGVGAIGAIYAGRILETYPYSLNFFYIFLVGAIGINVSWAFLALTREPEQGVPPPPKEPPKFWAKLKQVVGKDHNFKRFLQTRTVQALGTMGLGFVAVAAIQRLNVPDGTVALYTVALLAGQTASNLLTGWLADRIGHKLLLEAAGLAAAAAFILAWLNPAAIWYFVIFALLGASLGATIVSGTLISMEFSAPEQRPTYMGIANTTVGLSGALAPLLGATIARITNYGWMFFTSAVLCLLAVAALHWLVHDPRWKDNPAPSD